MAVTQKTATPHSKVKKPQKTQTVLMLGFIGPGGAIDPTHWFDPKANNFLLSGIGQGGSNLGNAALDTTATTQNLGDTGKQLSTILAALSGVREPGGGQPGQPNNPPSPIAAGSPLFIIGAVILVLILIIKK
jgi:hypothetical protein